ncbi:Sjoegren syndrome/scleroderma autoantigen 1 [Amphibalanus amphitrite]|uniref:Sjoegren syndrome/scleroderma autoantigen 1 n=1 Tax=Amphibalanus amphitrite TaxID=1232801 RepID=A0A6A4WYD3_AMPAM|nr:Sjoegren syndrome/scleroderma autoantigen 1 [Amphibalanus amphitrite]
MDDDMEWTPPTEAEMKVIQAKRERADKISNLMGSYLLKGYKMLNETCPKCTTIYLRDKQDELYCVACVEVDTDTEKDNPAAVSSPAAAAGASSAPPADAEDERALSAAAAAVRAKLSWAAGQLESASSVESSLQLVGLIRACADALQALRSPAAAQQSPGV